MKQYNELKKKYQLPELKELKKTFSIDSLEEEDLLNQIIAKAIEKIDTYVSVLENLLDPETSFRNVMEAKFIGDKEKKDIFEIYKKLMILKRTELEIRITNDEKLNAEFLNKLYDEWKKQEDKIISIIRKMKACWTQDKEYKTDLGYLG